MMKPSGYSLLGVSVMLLGAAVVACEDPGAAPSRALDDSDGSDDSEWADPEPADPMPPSLVAPPEGERPPAFADERLPEDATAACRPPSGVSGSPRTIAQAVELMNALPRPTTVACFIESLDRPLELYLTSSKMSAQPALDERSPRTFIVLEPLFISIVPDGEFASLVELGQRTSDDRSIKAEVQFPLTRDVTRATLFAQIGLGRASTCGVCHIGENLTPDEFFTDGAFESGVIAPFSVYEVPLDSLRTEATLCDAEIEPARCAILAALFRGGEVEASSVWAEENF